MGKIEGVFATNISGKVGNVVFRKAGKQNIVSQRPASVKNPRTDMQQRQRAYIKTVSSAYSVLKPICDHSFEGIAYGADSMNFFKKENYKIVSSAGRAVLKNSSNVVVDAAFLLSKGSIIWNSSMDFGGIFADISDYLKKNNLESIEQLTCAQLLDALNIKKGDQLTAINVLIDGSVYTDNNGTEQQACNLYYSRYIFEGGNSTENAFVKVEGMSFSTIYKLNASILAKESEIDANAVIIADTNGLLYINNMEYSQGDMFTVIISRRVADKWLRSTATLFQNGEIDECSIENALPSYNPTGKRYLNNAER